MGRGSLQSADRRRPSLDRFRPLPNTAKAERPASRQRWKAPCFKRFLRPLSVEDASQDREVPLYALTVAEAASNCRGRTEVARSQTRFLGMANRSYRWAAPNSNRRKRALALYRSRAVSGAPVEPARNRVWRARGSGFRTQHISTCLGEHGLIPDSWRIWSPVIDRLGSREFDFHLNLRRRSQCLDAAEPSIVSALGQLGRN